MPFSSGFSPASSIIDEQYWSIGSHDINHVERNVSAIPATSTAWVALIGVYVPFVLQAPATLYEAWQVNGSTATAHNVAFGIYNTDFTAVQVYNSVTGVTTVTSVVNYAAWPDLALNAGSYYMAFADDSTRNIQCTVDAIGLYQAAGVVEQAALAAGPVLPDPMVPVTYTRAFCPNFGFNLRSTAL